MENFTSLFNTASSIVAIAWFVCGIIFLLFRKNSKINSFISKHVLWLGLIITGVSLIGSLIYSNVIGYQACMFCWYARILLYPQFFLFLLALIKRERVIIDYALLLSVIGIIVSGYHYFAIDLGHVDLIACSSGGVSCATRYVYEFGFVTIPFMSLSAFVFLTGALASAKRALKQGVI